MKRINGHYYERKIDGLYFRCFVYNIRKNERQYWKYKMEFYNYIYRIVPSIYNKGNYEVLYAINPKNGGSLYRK